MVAAKIADHNSLVSFAAGIYVLTRTREKGIITDSTVPVLRLTRFVIKESEQGNQEGTCILVRSQISTSPELSSWTCQPS
jgi:hypothetical protein